MNYAVILAGGVGERFWPVSTPGRPKQLLRLISEKTMLRETVDRLEGVVDPSHRLVVTNASLTEAVRGECEPIDPGAVIGEPCGRNTAPAIGLACGLLQSRDPDAVVIVLPADHALGQGCRTRSQARRIPRHHPDLRGDGVRLHPARSALRSRSERRL